jgi:hypothetical protein
MTAARAASAPGSAALALCALLFVAALPAPEPRAEACLAPAERAAEQGASRAVACSGGAALRGPARLLYGLRLDPNRASADALTVLPGIGPARAAAIVARRDARPFASLSELASVPGIGPVTLAGIAPYLAVEAEAPRGASSSLRQ